MALRTLFTWRPGGVRAALVRVLLGVAILQVLYLLLANTLLVSPLLRYLASTSRDVKLDYRWAVSPWFGKVFVRDLSLRIEDRNIQALLSIERGTLNVNLPMLAAQEFHAWNVRVQGVAFKMRHKVSRVGEQAPRLAAYPRIAGFDDPPLFTEPASPPGSLTAEQKKRLWKVVIEGVEADANEIWILEYRYQGPARATGKFTLHAAQYFEVGPATLQLMGGKITLGDVPVATSTSLALQLTVGGTNPDEISGIEPLEKTRAELTAALEGTDLRFLNAYLEPRANLTATGAGAIKIRAILNEGVLDPGTLIEVTADEFMLAADQGRVRATAPAIARLIRLDDPARLNVDVTTGRLLLEREGEAASPTVDGFGVNLTSTPNLAQPIRVLSMALSKTRVTLPDLRWVGAVLDDTPQFKDAVQSLTGHGRFELAGERNEAGSLSGTTRVELTRLALHANQVQFNGGADVRARFSKDSGADSAVSFERIRLGVTDSTLAVSKRSTRPVTVSLASRDLVVRGTEPRSARGTVDITADSAQALLPLVVESPLLRQVQTTLLGLRDMKARSTFNVTDSNARFDVLQARSGDVHMRGFISGSKGGPAGAFLVSTPVANVGFRVAAGDVQVQFLVRDDWLPGGARPTKRQSQAAAERTPVRTLPARSVPDR